jgi:hypothetical protein
MDLNDDRPDGSRQGRHGRHVGNRRGVHVLHVHAHPGVADPDADGQGVRDRRATSGHEKEGRRSKRAAD